VARSATIKDWACGSDLAGQVQMQDEGRRTLEGTRHCGSDEPGADTGGSTNLGGAGNCESDGGYRCKGKQNRNSKKGSTLLGPS
jgi:hypothetical protein